jgi:SET domain
VNPLVSELDTRFEARASGIPGAGLGLFAREPLPAGTELEAVGALVARDSLADRCSHFADHHKFVVGESLLLVPLGLAGLANHSFAPNAEKVVRDSRVFLRLLRAVVAGEEICFAYRVEARDRMGLNDKE